IFGDPEVMERIPTGPSRDLDHSRRRLERIIESHERFGFSLWALIEKATGDLIGDCGLFHVEGKGPDVELAYHLVRSRWRMGYITEAANACVEYGFRHLALDRIIALTDGDHFVSRRVMEKVGMTYDGPAHHYGRELVRYAISNLGDTA
ncbi:MAG TPA: GNAT family N-acetyltransferase, partial [Actinomycetota bacterium]|nr:GNAT family N-acetyltransferase [Actinomycetota bacterium]